jgi:hypothetical protein
LLQTCDLLDDVAAQNVELFLSALRRMRETTYLHIEFMYSAKPSGNRHAILDAPA